MAFHMMKVSVLLGLGFLAGCNSGPSYVPVSGVVKLDGQPLAGVMVLFQPVATNGMDSGGVGSTAMTDENGKFTLQASTASPVSGALVGKHTVKIATPPPKNATPAEDSDAATTVGQKGAKLWTDPLPEKYNVNSELTFTVPPSGTDQANFDLTSGKK